MRVWAMLLPMSVGRRLNSRFERVGRFLVDLSPELKSDIILADIEYTAEEYMLASVASAAVFGAFMFTFTYLSLQAIKVFPGMEAPISAIPAVLILLLNFFVLIRYPRILALKRAELIEKDLVYALKDLLLNISAGLSLFESIRTVSEVDYGYVSDDLKRVVEDTNRGTALDDALEDLALRTSSDYMRNAVWQTVNAVKAGTSVKDALSGIIEALIREQKRKIQNYIQELNVLTMVYMLFAVAIPTIITTVLVVLTSLMSTGITEEIYVFVIIICILIQLMLVGLIKSRRPLVYAS